MTSLLAHGGWVLTGFTTFEETLNGGRTSPFHATRKAALNAFSATGFPSPKIEEWKYTDISSFVSKPYALASKSFNQAEVNKLIEQAFKPQESIAKLVFVNGSFNSELSASLDKLPKGVSITSLKLGLGKTELSHGLRTTLDSYLTKIADFKDNAIVALNTAFISDGVAIHVAKDITVSAPIQILFVSTGNSEAMTFPRSLVRLESGASLEIIETYVGDSSRYYTNAVAEISLDTNANLSHVKVQDEGLSSLHTSAIFVNAANDSKFNTFSFNFGSATTRNELSTTIAGSNIDGGLYGLSVLNNAQHVDNSTVIDHAQPHSQTTERYKGIYDDKSRGVFQGTIIVREDAQKTNAIQSNRAILLSNEASMDAKPQLKIWADDVKCTHGATVGQLDADAMFYLQSRGIGYNEARNILLSAFAEEILATLNIPGLKEFVVEKIKAKLEN